MGTVGLGQLLDQVIPVIFSNFTDFMILQWDWTQTERGEEMICVVFVAITLFKHLLKFPSA